MVDQVKNELSLAREEQSLNLKIRTSHDNATEVLDNDGYPLSASVFLMNVSVEAHLSHDVEVEKKKAEAIQQITGVHMRLC